MSDANPSAIAQERTAAARELIAWTRAEIDGKAFDRDLLNQIRQRVQDLAARRDLWSEADFAPPEGEERQARYLIGQENPEGITLYLNVMRPGKKIPPHDHTTWACVAAVEGSEINTLFDRLDDGTQDGYAKLAAVQEIDLAPGSSVALMPDDIHSVEIRGEQIIRHLHFYGRPLETLTARKAFDLDHDSYKIMSVGVKTRS